MAIAGTIVFDVKIGVDIVLAENGKHCVNVVIIKAKSSVNGLKPRVQGDVDPPFAPIPIRHMQV